MVRSKFKPWFLLLVIFIIPGISVAQHDPKGLNISYSFSADGKEVIINEPNLPEPWLNRLTNDVFHTWITQNGYIESFLLNPDLNGLVNPQDVSGHLYLRDQDGQHILLNNRGSNTTSWKSIHGLGYTQIQTSGLGINCTVTYFVPRNDDVLVTKIKLHNNGDKTKTLDLFSQVEWSLGDVTKSIVYKGDGRGGSQFNLYKKVTMENQTMIARQLVWKTLGPAGKPWPYIGFMASSLPVKGFETGKERFLGVPGDFSNPAQVVDGKCSNTNFWSENEYPWGVLQNSFELKPGQDMEVVIVLGMSRDVESIRQLKNKYADLNKVQEEFAKLSEFYSHFLNTALKVSTPEKSIDRIINIWSPYQWRSTMSKDLNTGKRGLSFWNYAIEDGSFGFWGGDAELAVQPHDLQITKEMIQRNFSMQFYDAKNTRRLSAAAPAMLYDDVDFKLPKETAANGFKVSHHHEVYGLYAISLYLRETGDFDFLTEKIPFVLGEPATVFDHMVKGVDYALNGISPRGLPYVNKGVGDWNDEINRMSSEGKAESIMYGMQLCYLLKEYAAIATIAGHSDKAKEWMEKHELIKQACNKYAWDGDWYVYAFADGEKEPVPIGAAKNKEGSIYLNSQSWSVIGGVADKLRADKALESVRSRLLSEFGPLLFMPSYTLPDKHVGVQSEYAPGWRNACMYPRPAGWAIMAACLANKPDLAWAMYKPASLPYISENIERYRAEPYVYTENYVGPDHPKAGLGQFKWNLGEGTNWMWHSFVYYILGIRPELDGLLVDPKIPSNWPGFTMEREFRGDQYLFEVVNPSKVGQGVKSITLDGKLIKGNLITPVKDGKKHRVKVIMGEK